MDVLITMLIVLAIIVVGAFIHFLPTFVAFIRGHPSRWAIFCINFFLGWTGIGWIVALAWSATSAATATDRVQHHIYHQPPHHPHHPPTQYPPRR